MVAALSDPISEPTQRVSAVITQNGEQKGTISVLPDSGSVTEIMPTTMATELGLTLYEINQNKYKLESANRSPILVQHESTFDLGFSPSRIISITCLISYSLKSSDLIISWRAMI